MTQKEAEQAIYDCVRPRIDAWVRKCRERGMSDAEINDMFNSTINGMFFYR